MGVAVGEHGILLVEGPPAALGVGECALDRLLGTRPSCLQLGRLDEPRKAFRLLGAGDEALAFGRYRPGLLQGRTQDSQLVADREAEFGQLGPRRSRRIAPHALS
jgi:hypothetical protein